MQVIRRTPVDYRVMPWKNGGGITHEMFIYPENADMGDDGFLWRLSSANITEDGPFSSFPDYDRVLFLLSGKGANITVDGADVRLASQFDSLRFSGATPAYSRLIDGPVTDLNLFYRRDALSCEYRQLFPRREMERLFLPGNTTIMVCLQGEATVGIGGEQPLREMELLVVLEHTWGQPLVVQYERESRLLFMTLSRRTGHGESYTE